MTAGDLTTLQHAKDWLGITDQNSDALLARMITSASKVILNFLNRSGLAATVYSDIMNGYGQNFMPLRQWPVISVTSLVFSGVTLTQQAQGNPPTNGYVLNDNPSDSAAGGQQTVTLFGYCFPNGRSAVTANYVAGYQITNEAHTVPATPYAVQPDVTWLQDGGVTLANGTPLTKVAASPAAMQYIVSATGLYTFNAAQAAATVLITYSYVPQDVEQACWELVGLRYREKDRIGVQTKSLGGQETVSYFKGNMPPDVQATLQNYMRVTPA